MYIVAIAWVYVVLLMAMTEPSITAGVMTFLMYCVFPLYIVLYLMGTRKRKQEREKMQSTLKQPASPSASGQEKSH